MASSKDIAVVSATTDTPEAPAAGTRPELECPLPIATPMIAAALRASRQSAAIELGKIEPEQPAAVDATAKPAHSHPEDAATTEAALEALAAEGKAAQARRWWHLPRPVLLAASLALAAGVGVIAGAGATLGLRPVPSPAESPDAVAAAANKKLQESITRLQGEIASLKTGLDIAQRTAGTQFSKLAEGIERLERRAAQRAAEATGSIALPPPPPVAPAASIVSRDEQRPPAAEGWRLRDYYAGRAIVETPAGRLFDVGAGSNLPGLGRVERIKRADGRVEVITRNGTIAASLEERRPLYRPYR